MWKLTHAAYCGMVTALGSDVDAAVVRSAAAGARRSARRRGFDVAVRESGMVWEILEPEVASGTALPSTEAVPKKLAVSASAAPDACGAHRRGQVERTTELTVLPASLPPSEATVCTAAGERPRILYEPEPSQVSFTHYYMNRGH